MKLFLTKIPFLLLFIFSAFSLSTGSQDSLSANKLPYIHSKIDSIEATIVDQQMNLTELDQKCNALETSFNNNKNHISITDLLAILLSCLTLIYVVRADRVNSLFGSYQGKKRYKAIQLQIGELYMKLDEIKSDFKEIIEAEPRNFVKNGKKEIAKLELVLNKAMGSKNYYHPGDSPPDNQELVYETRPNSEIVYLFNKHVIAVQDHCKNIIRKTQDELDKKIKDTRMIRYGEDD